MKKRGQAAFPAVWSGARGLAALGKAACPLFLLLVCSCRCPTSAPDAGTLVQRSIDLRSALQLIFPEYRGTRVMSCDAKLTRTVTPASAADLAKAKELAAQNGFTGDPLKRDPFTMGLTLQGDVLTLTLSLPISPEEIGRIYAAPAAMTSEAMGHWFPKLDAPISREVFEVKLDWQAVRAQRASFLNWQLIDGARNATWRIEGAPPDFTPDAGPDGVPDPFKVTLVDPGTTARIDIDRAEEYGHLKYTLVTRERH